MTPAVDFDGHWTKAGRGCHGRRQLGPAGEPRYMLGGPGQPAMMMPPLPNTQPRSYRWTSARPVNRVRKLVEQAPGLRRALSPPNGLPFEIAVSRRINHLRMSFSEIRAGLQSRMASVFIRLHPWPNLLAASGGIGRDRL
jgi:hypothetical protein